MKQNLIIRGWGCKKSTTIYITCFSTRWLKIPCASSSCKWLPLCGSNKSFYVILIDRQQLRSFRRLTLYKYELMKYTALTESTD